MTTTARLAAILGAVLALAGCTVHQTVPPGVTGPSDESAAFAVSPSQIAVNVPITFDGSASRPPSGANAIASFQWSFGDGDSATGRTVTHTFKRAGDFNVVLTTTDDRGGSSSVGRLLQVTVSDPPKIDFQFSPSPVAVDDPVQFTAAVAPAAGRTIVAVNWNFGEPTSPTNTATGTSVNHTFKLVGDLTITVVATDDAGQVGTKSLPLHVSNGDPIASFVWVPAAPVAGQQVVFDANASTAFGSARIVSYTWTGIPGQQGQGAVVSSGPSGFSTDTPVILVVTDSRGRTGTAVNEVKLK